MATGNKYGTHRVLTPPGVMPQTAERISNDMTIYDNEILIDVTALNIDSARFTQIEAACDHDVAKISRMILEIVAQRGKLQNPVTGSGGMLIGSVAAIGPALVTDLKAGDRIATLVSLSLTPLRIDEILSIEPAIDRVKIRGQAILFESGLYARLPEDLPESLALAALDIAGAPAQTAKLVRPGDSVLVLGAAGKSGLMCCYEAKKRCGPTGRVVGLDYGEANLERLEGYGFCHEVIIGDATKPVEILEKALAANGGREFDVAINVVNVPNTEMASIVPVRDGGIVYFFSMATSFTKAALGAEGIGKDVTMIIGNGYTKGHAEITLEELRESATMREIFEGMYE